MPTLVSHGEADQFEAASGALLAFLAAPAPA